MATGDANVTTAPAGPVALTVMLGGAAGKVGDAMHDDDPTAMVVVPGGHGVAAIAPTVLTKLPIGAGVQAIAPATGEK